MKIKRKQRFNIIFEDEFLLVVEKEPGLLSVPSPSKNQRSLTDLLGDYLKDKKERAYPCHRIDKEASGLIIYAKNIEVQKDIMAQFRRREVKKLYTAFVEGRVKKKSGLLKGYIKAKGKPPKFAVTRFKTLKLFKDFSVLEVEPLTGRTNQIRLHFLSLGHPLVGERKYTVAKKWPVKFKRLCLHACYIGFRHPVSREFLSLSSDLPSDLKEFLSSASEENR